MSNALATNRPTEWVSKDEAIRQLEAAGMLSRGAKRPVMLEDWCAAGGDVLESKARLAILADGRNVRDMLIPKEVWKGIRENRGFFDARGDHLSGTAQGMVGLKKLQAYGIQFRKDQLDELAPAVDRGGVVVANLQDETKATPGRKKQVDKWEAFWMAVLDIAVAGDLDREIYPSQADLRADLLKRTGDCLADKTIEPVVRKIYLKFIGLD